MTLAPADATVEVRGCTGELHVTGPTGTAVEVLDPAGRAVARGELDRFGDRLAELGVTDRVRGRGGFVARGLEPGPHVVRADGLSAGESQVVVLAPGEVPPDHARRVLGQRLDEGYGYLEVRDGTTLGVNVALPDPARFGPGPYPTVVQYSGYHPSRPGFLTGDPADDTTLNTEANVCLHLGFAVVGVNMRGSGGSGGPFALFSPLVAFDGHDVVEVVARQPWCGPDADAPGRVGMLGRSMPGFSQLLVAATRPPSLAAIAPASVAGRPYVCSYPGGIPNGWLVPRLGFWEVDPPSFDDAILGGFAIEGARYEYYDAWLVDHVERADDQRAAENQLLRGHNVDMAAAARAGTFADHEVHQRVQPYRWVDQVEVPTLLMGTWQDQDSGPGFVELPERFPPTTPLTALFANGTHESSRFPGFLRRWVAFLGQHLAGAAPAWTDEAQAYLEAVGVPGDPAPPPVPGPAPRHAGAPPGGPAAPGVTVQVDVGGGDPDAPGAPYPSAEVHLDRWPPPTTTTRLHLADGGALVDDAPTAAAAATRWRYDPRTKPVACAGDGFDINAAVPDYDWRPLPAGHAAPFVSAPFAHDALLLGTAALDLWITCSAPDVDLEVTLSEVRSDGWETFVQNGWQRASHRRLDAGRSTERAPWPTHEAADATPLEAGVPTLLRIPIGAFGHLVRAGSRVRVAVEAPGGNQPHWTFRPCWPEGVDDAGAPVQVEVLHDRDHPSVLLLPTVEVDPPDGGWPPPPEPGALRRQPSRRYRPAGIEVDPARPLPPPDPADRPPLVVARALVQAEGAPGGQHEDEGAPAGPVADLPAPVGSTSALGRALRRARRVAGRARRSVRRALARSG